MKSKCTHLTKILNQHFGFFLDFYQSSRLQLLLCSSALPYMEVNKVYILAKYRHYWHFLRRLKYTSVEIEKSLPPTRRRTCTCMFITRNCAIWPILFPFECFTASKGSNFYIFICLMADLIV